MQVLGVSFFSETDPVHFGGFRKALFTMFQVLEEQEQTEEEEEEEEEEVEEDEEDEEDEEEEDIGPMISELKEVTRQATQSILLSVCFVVNSEYFIFFKRDSAINCGSRHRRIRATPSLCSTLEPLIFLI